MYKFITTLIISILIAALPANASEQEQINPVNDVVIPMFNAVLAEDLATLKSLSTPEAQIYAMFNPTGETGEGSVRQFPVLGYFDIVAKNYENIKFIDRTYSVTNNGRTVWMEANGDLRLTATKSPYRNRYVFKITLNGEGKISEIKEWVNTVTLTQQGITAR